MSDVAIRVESLGKMYRIGGKQERYNRFTETAMDALTAPLRRLRRMGKPAPPEETIWALRDVSFEVKRGEAIGIIGRNGAGKSTLLKILSRITEPTTGRVELHGRVSSLLEVGTGFHPELTGRENIYLNGAILGMRRAEIDRKFDEIVAFSGVEQFLDTPVKRYSSGMHVRLAFAVAAHLEPEILLVDEVLAVGDAEFQKKCLGKMGEVASQGRTILFVSHNMAAIVALCQSCVLLDKGRVVRLGETRSVVDHHLYNPKTSTDSKTDLSDPALRQNSVVNSLFKWSELIVTNSSGSETTSIGLREPFDISLRGELTQATDSLRVGLSIESSLGFSMFNSYAEDDDLPTQYSPGEITFKVRFRYNLLAPGMYTIGLGANGPGIVDWIPRATALHIEPVSIDDSFTLRSNYGGVIIHPCKWVLGNEGL